jgi:competence protein ComEC
VIPMSPALMVLAAGTWMAAVAGRWWGWGGVVMAVGLAAGAGLRAGPSGRRGTMTALTALVVAAGGASGALSMDREEAILAHPTRAGEVEMTVRLLDDPRRGPYGWWARAVADPPEAGRPAGVPMLLSFDVHPGAVAAETLRVRGWRSARAGRVGGDPYSGVVTGDWAPVDGDGGGPVMVAGNAVRERILERLAGGDTPEALLAGFLVGDTSGVPAADLEAMRRAGLSHLVAVSGSNVALFLTLTFLALGPLGSGPRRRAVLGLAAVAVLVVATRWEPSVVRASIMAALVLGGRVGGWALDALSALAVTVVLAVVVSGELATEVGFTLSVLATGGVVVGSRRARASPVLVRVLAAGLGAQVAVAPVLLAAFGTMPLLSPLTNLVAVPVVSATTTVAAVGAAAGFGSLLEVAAVGASLVLGLARLASSWPQLGWPGAGLVAALALLAARPLLRPAVAVAGAVLVAFLVTGGGVDRPAMVVLDVGQGDAILLLGREGGSVLVDGGPDPAVLEAKLAGLGVHHLDLVVLTHVHADHATGLAAVFGRRPVDRFWAPGPPHETARSRQAITAARAAGVPITSAPVGETVEIGGLVIEVLGPVRRYAAPNDQSAVLLVRDGDGPRALLTGDIETHAQADLAGTVADVLKVPHQGGATSDLDWLASLGADLAVVSVGPNQFGHPAPTVLATLERAGAQVLRTDLDGDVVVPLDGTAPSHGR